MIKIDNFCHSALNGRLCLADVHGYILFMKLVFIIINTVSIPKIVVDINFVGLTSIKCTHNYISGGAQIYTCRCVMVWSQFVCDITIKIKRIEIYFPLWISIYIMHPCNNFDLWTVNKKSEECVTSHSDFLEMFYGLNIKVKCMAPLLLGDVNNFLIPPRIYYKTSKYSHCYYQRTTSASNTQLLSTSRNPSSRVRQQMAICLQHGWLQMGQTRGDGGVSTLRLPRWLEDRVPASGDKQPPRCGGCVPIGWLSVQRRYTAKSLPF